jgi:replicative DNA helicase
MSDKIEKIIIGTILMFKEYQDVIINSLDIDLFYNDINRLVYRKIYGMYQKSESIDLLTIVPKFSNNELKDVGGAYYLSTYTSEIASGIHYKDHINILKEAYIKRNLITLFQSELACLSNHDNDIYQTYVNVNKKLEDLFSLKDSSVRNIYDVMKDRIHEVEKIKPNELLGVTSGIKNIDKVTNGWQPSDMIVLAARPSMGKTAISLLFAKNPVLNGQNILYFSLEMSSQRISDRIISLGTGINSKKIQSNNLKSDDWIQIEENVLQYKNNGFYINDESGLTIENIINISLLEVKKNNIKLILIDYLQLIHFSLKSGTTNDQITHISKNIKNLAKKTNLPVIVLSQLSRDVEKRGDKRPMLSDLRDSGSIEQDADIVIFLYRDDYYNEESEDKNMIEFLIRKFRNGEVCMTELYRNNNWSRISGEEFEEIPEFDDYET